MSALNPNLASPGRPGASLPRRVGLRVYELEGESSSRAVARPGRRGVCPYASRAGVSRRLRGQDGPSIAGKMPALLSQTGVCPYARRAGVWRRLRGQDGLVDCRQDAGATFADEASAPTRDGLACRGACEGKMGLRLPARCRRYFRYEASGRMRTALLGISSLWERDGGHEHGSSAVAICRS